MSQQQASVSRQPAPPPHARRHGHARPARGHPAQLHHVGAELRGLPGPLARDRDTRGSLCQLSRRPRGQRGGADASTAAPGCSMPGNRQPSGSIKPRRRPSRHHCRSDYRFGVGRVVLLPLDVRLHVRRWHETDLVTDCRQIARPIVRRGTGLHADQAGSQPGEEAANPRTAKPLFKIGWRASSTPWTGKPAWRVETYGANGPSISSGWGAPPATLRCRRTEREPSTPSIPIPSAVLLSLAPP